MIRKLILNRLDAEERQLGESLDYLRHMARVSLRAFFKFAKVMPLATYRRVLPADAYYVARIVATRDEDCGTCVQIEINLAKSERVSVDVLRAVIADDIDSLPADLADVCRFARSVVEHTGDDELLRETIRQRYGEQGLVEMSLAIAVCRVFPTAKRALGFATSCRLVKLDV